MHITHRHRRIQRRWSLSNSKYYVTALTFDAELRVSAELENNQHEEESDEGHSSDSHHHVNLKPDLNILILFYLLLLKWVEE